MKKQLDSVTTHISNQWKYMMIGMALFSLTSISLRLLGQLYYQHFDNTIYYKIFSPIPVERKQVQECSYVNAYVHRVVLTPITGTVFRQLVLINIDTHQKMHISQKYTNSFEANMGDETIIHHWKLPCDIPLGWYQFEGVVDYKVGNIEKKTIYQTELFEIVASPSALLVK